MHARVTRIAGERARLDAATAWFQEELLEQLERMEGYRDAMLLVDREHGEALAVSFWDSASSMKESERRAQELRAEAAARADGSVTHVDRYELVVQASAAVPH
jgi:heme-degrading monooxygenase HmoA